MSEFSNQPPVSIVVIGRDEEAHLPGCFGAIADIDYPKDRLEVVYVDSGSRDSSVEIAAASGARVITADGAVRSAGQARNIGWMAASSEIVHFVDGDVFISPDYLRTAVRFLADAGVACVFGMLEEREVSTNWVSRVLATDWRSKEPGDADAPGAGGTFRRSALRDVGGYDARAVVAEETYLGRRLRASGYRILMLGEPMGTHDYGVWGCRGLATRSFRLGEQFGSLLHATDEDGRPVHMPGRKLLVQSGSVMALIGVFAARRRWAWLFSLVPLIYLLLVPYVLIRFWQQIAVRGLGWPAFVYYYLGYGAKPILLAGMLWSIATHRFKPTKGRV